MREIIIIGGGIAGLVNALRLAKEGFDVLLIERKSYPYHKVCGEYVSNETLPYLKSLGADPAILHPANITDLAISSPSGRMISLPLDMGGFGISRYAFDNYLFEKAKAAGAEFMLNSKVANVQYFDGYSLVSIEGREPLKAKVVIGSFGKRSNLDKTLQRPFMKKRSPYIGVKYHIRANFPVNMIALHNFKDGYCGINKIEEDMFCLCYLTTRQNLLDHKNIQEMEKKVLYRNPHLEGIFSNATFIYDKPEVINEVSFASKGAVENHVLMCGDSAGMIAPLCGNGMGMAMHSPKILSEEIISYFKEHNRHEKLETRFSARWQSQFAGRLKAGRIIQGVFGKTLLSEAVIILGKIDPLAKWIVKQTHGEVF